MTVGVRPLPPEARAGDTAELGFKAKTPLDAGVALALAWYKDAGWLKW